MMQAGLGAFAPQSAQGSQPVGAAPPTLPTTVQPPPMAQAMGPQPLPDPLKQLIEASKIIKQANMVKAMQGQQAVAEMAQGQPTVKEQIDRALGATPYGFAGGGIVAFADGGDLGFQKGGDPEVERILKKSPYSRTPEENEKLEAAGIPLAQRTIPTDSWLRRFDQWLASPFIREAITGGALNLSDEDLTKRTDTAASNEKIARSLLGAKQVEPTTTPTLPAYLDESRKRDVLSAMRPAAAAQPAATPAARSAAPAGDTPDVQSPPAARPDGLGDAFNAYRRQQDILAELMRSQGTTPEEVLEARRQYDEAMAGMMKGEEQALADAQAAAGRSIFDDDEILAEMLAGLSGARTFGEALVGAGAAAARGRASRKKAVAEAKKGLNKLRRDLAMKQAELQLARKEGDVNRARTTAVEIQKLKVAVEESSLDYQLKSKDAETRRIAAEITRDRPATGQVTPAVRANAIRQAISSVDSGKIEEKLKTNLPYLRASPAEKARMLAAEKVNAVVRQLAGYGVTPDEVAAMYNAPIAGASTGVTRQRYDAQGNLIQ